MHVRCWHVLLALGLATGLSLSGCSPAPERRLAHSVRRELAAGQEASAQWRQAAQGAEALSNEAALGALYLERLQLGLGSPFRLIDFALNDPRLPDSTRVRLAWAILAELVEGNAYRIDPRVLDRAGTLGLRARPGLGAEHLRVIENAIARADHPVAAETGLRTAYTIAWSEGLVSGEAPRLIANVAALLVDRELAHDDAHALMRELSNTGGELALMLQSWRAERRLEVERPRPALATELEIESIRIAHDVLAELRVLALTNVAGSWVQTETRAQEPGTLQAEALRTLEALESALDPPPQTPIVIAARQLTREAAPLPWLSSAERGIRAKFAARALNEESFVLEYARLSAQSPHDAAPARAALQAAIGLRAYSQEAPWFPGMPAPAARDLRERYGLSAISFDASVPAHWRPYYRRMLASALDDLHRVMPAINLRGLHVHFGAASLGDVLAMHDPQGRRLVLPPATSAGTIGHELAHDLDWQVALRRYRVRGDYATDRADRTRDLALATRVRNLAASSRAASPGGTSSAHARRPAEIFARNVDWYLAVSLAREGRRNGYLSSVQDEVITGYGTVRPPDVSGEAGEALMTILAELAPLYREQEDAFRGLYGRSRTQRGYDLVRRVTEAPALPTAAGIFAAVSAARDSALTLIEGNECGYPRQFVPAELQAARRSIVLAAADARARGAALRQAERWLGTRARLELAGHFYGGPLSLPAVDSMRTSALSDIASQVHELGADVNVGTMDPFQMPGLACAAPRSPF